MGGVAVSAHMCAAVCRTVLRLLGSGGAGRGLRRNAVRRVTRLRAGALQGLTLRGNE
jgi:hypothetical protein